MGEGGGGKVRKVVKITKRKRPKSKGEGAKKPRGGALMGNAFG